MKKSIVICLGIICWSLSASYIYGQDIKPTMRVVAFIAGCWEINDTARKRLVSEQWMSPVGNAMMGMSRTVRNEKMGAFEFLRIVEDDSGINYISKPSQNKEETAFKLVKWAANEVTFENPKHDFPQRIIYKQTKPNTLDARIEGKQRQKEMGIDFPMKRVKCE